MINPLVISVALFASICGGFYSATLLVPKVREAAPVTVPYLAPPQCEPWEDIGAPPPRTIFRAGHTSATIAG